MPYRLSGWPCFNSSSTAAIGIEPDSALTVPSSSATSSSSPDGKHSAMADRLIRVTNTGSNRAAVALSRISLPLSVSADIWSYSSFRSGVSLSTGISNSSLSNMAARTDPSSFNVWTRWPPTTRTRSEALHR